MLISLRWWIAKLAYAFSDSIWIVNVSSSILLFPESGQYLSHLIWNKMHMIWLNYNRIYAWCHSCFISVWKGSFFCEYRSSSNLFPSFEQFYIWSYFYRTYAIVLSLVNKEMSQNNVNYLKRWYVCNVISTIIKQMLDGFFINFI